MSEGVWVDDGAWRVCGAGLLCRFRGCRAPAVAEMLRRGRRGGPHWWAYCGDHTRLYGRRVEGGRVLCEALRGEP
jgi:hypothetical protein